MAAMSLSTYKRRLNEYLAAETAVLQGQSYSIKDRTLTRADLNFIQRQITYLEGRINQMARGGGIRVHRSVIRDS